RIDWFTYQLVWHRTRAPANVGAQPSSGCSLAADIDLPNVADLRLRPPAEPHRRAGQRLDANNMAKGGSPGMRRGVPTAPHSKRFARTRQPRHARQDAARAPWEGGSARAPGETGPKGDAREEQAAIACTS